MVRPKMVDEWSAMMRVRNQNERLVGIAGAVGMQTHQWMGMLGMRARIGHPRLCWCAEGLRTVRAGCAKRLRPRHAGCAEGRRLVHVGCAKVFRLMCAGCAKRFSPMHAGCAEGSWPMQREAGHGEGCAKENSRTKKAPEGFSGGGMGPGDAESSGWVARRGTWGVQKNAVPHMLGVRKGFSPVHAGCAE